MSETEKAFAVEYDDCLKKLNLKINQLNLEITPQTITTVIQLGMEIVESSKLKGEAQKKIVTKIVKKVVEDAPISDEKEKLILDLIELGVLGNVIDLVVSASKGEININSAITKASGCCLTFLKRK